MEGALYGIYALAVFVNNSCVNTVRQHFPWSILHFCACLPFILLIFYNQKYSKLEGKQMQRKTRWRNLQTVRLSSLLG